MSSRSLNKVTLIGNLTRDPELRYTPQGTAVCSFGLATNRGWVDASNQRQEATEFHRIVAWHKLAELCSQLLFKGRKTYVEGRLQTRTWTGSDGQERTTTEVVIDNMIVLDNKRREGSFDQNTFRSSQRSVSPASTKVADDKVKKDLAGDKKDEELKKESKDNLKEDKKEDKVKDEKKPKKEKESEEVKAEDIPF